MADTAYAFDLLLECYACHAKHRMETDDRSTVDWTLSCFMTRHADCGKPVQS